MDSSANASVQAFTHVTTGYYRSSDPQMAALALHHMLRMVAATKPEDLGRLVNLFYLFHRIARLSEEARARFGPVLRDYEGPHKELAHRILEARDDGGSPNVLDLVVEGPEHLDLLWAEFFVTGSSDPILRIIGTLDREDCVRRHLDRWLHGGSFFGKAKRRATATTLREVGLEVDLDAKAILTNADLDCLCFSIAERKFPIFKHLPFTLAREDLLVLSSKGAALWSLRLNSAQHARVTEICCVERSRPGGAARLRLTEPIEGKPFVL